MARKVASLPKFGPILTVGIVMRLITMLFFVLVSSQLVAAANPETGKALYTTCASCHGAAGEGNQAMSAPRLAHLGAVYLEAQLNKFKVGHRGSAGASTASMQMAPMAATLADEQAVADVVAYITSLEGQVSAPSVEGDIQMGGDYYNQFCGACHGRTADGNPALNSPRLAGSDDWYLLAQLQAFRAGMRGSHADDRSGKQMRAMANILPNEQALKDVVAFIRSLEQ
jgi:cytochrome c553